MSDLFFQMSNVESTLIEFLSKATNYADSKGVSYFIQPDVTAETVLFTRSQEMKDFIFRAAEKYSSPGGCVLDVACGTG